MRFLRRNLEALLVPTAVTMLLLGPGGSAFASDIPAAAARGASHRESDLATIRAALDRPAVAEKLADADLPREALLDRFEGMTAADVHYFAERLRAEPKSGEGVAEAVAAVLIVGLIIFCVLVLTDNIHLTDSEKRTGHLPAGVRNGPAGDVLVPGQVLG